MSPNADGRHPRRWSVLATALLVGLTIAGCAPMLTRAPSVDRAADQRQATQYFIQAKTFEFQQNYLGAIVALRSAAASKLALPPCEAVTTATPAPLMINLLPFTSATAGFELA